MVKTAHTLQLYSDASANPDLGVGAVFGRDWLFAKWESGFIAHYKPSIQYLELFGVCAAILTWGYKLKNIRITVFCDNESVCHMINSSSAKCKNCMFLIRLLVLSGLIDNRRVFAKHVPGKFNGAADSLSRLDFKRFWRDALPGTCPNPTLISTMIWPPSRIWQTNNQSCLQVPQLTEDQN